MVLRKPAPPRTAPSAASDPFAAVLKKGGHGERAAVELVPVQPGFTIAIDGLLSAAECAALIGAADAAGWHAATAADRAPKKNEAYLDRDRVDFCSAPFEAELWQRLQPHLPLVDTPAGPRAPVRLHSDGRRGEPGQCRVYRYVAGHRFGKHVDVSRRGSAPGEETEYTLLIYLASQGDVPPTPAGARAPAGDAFDGRPLAGGDTVFWASARAELVRVAPRAGLALLHAHGRRCLMHEAEEVTRGVKYVLRADVLYVPAGPSLT